MGGKQWTCGMKFIAAECGKMLKKLWNICLSSSFCFPIWTVWLFSWIRKHERKKSAFIFSKQHASKNVSAWQMASRKLLVFRHFPKRSLKIFWNFLFAKISSDVVDVCEKILNIFKKEIFTKEIQFDNLLIFIFRSPQKILWLLRCWTKTLERSTHRDSSSRACQSPSPNARTSCRSYSGCWRRIWFPRSERCGVQS